MRQSSSHDPNPAPHEQPLIPTPTKTNRPAVFGIMGLLAAIGIVAVIAANAATAPIISNDFASADKALTPIAGGSWAVSGGVEQLTDPAAPADDTLTNLAVHPVVVNQAQWRYRITGTVTTSVPEGTGFATVFGFTNATNYWYAYLGGANSGLFRVQNGTTSKLADLTTTISSGQPYTVEVRNEDSDLKVYIGTTFLGKAKNTLVPAGGKFGVGTRGSAANFDNLVVEASGLTTTPAPTPSATPTPTPLPSTSPVPTPTTTPIPLPTGGRRVNVSNSTQLTAALSAAQPGDDIVMADGAYTGKARVGNYTGSFVATAKGTAAKPIVLRGGRGAVIDGDGLGGHYGLYAVGATYWRFDGFTITNATKGFVLDGSTFNTVTGLRIYQTGQEGIHFRSHSSDNILMNSEITDTGRKTATYGEGVYVGSANSNWGTYTGGQPDHSDRNQIIGNTIARTGAESMDIKEGTTGGVIRSNHMDGAGMTGSWADSWIDMKGNNWTVSGNTGVTALLDGFQIHTALAGWGNNNLFSGNRATVNAAGWGLSIQKGATGNVWKCDNIVTAAAKGAVSINNLAVPCTP